MIVVKRTGQDVHMETGRDYWYHDLMALPIASPYAETEVMDAEDPLFILYTSGTTGKPKGVLHTHGGYQVYTSTTLSWAFDIKDDDRWWCAADPGWITGHSYIVYSPLILGATSIIYEGAPNFPYPDRWWRIVEEYGVTILYTAPTAIRGLMRFGDAWVQRHDLNSLRLLGTVGEPINPEAWRWYNSVVGNETCPIIDTWWQTETGGFMITPLPSVGLKPGSATRPFLVSKPILCAKMVLPVTLAKMAIWSSGDPGLQCYGQSGVTTNVSLTNIGANIRNRVGIWQGIRLVKMKMAISG